MKLQSELFGATFQSPVMLAAGTCGFGLELAEVAAYFALVEGLDAMDCARAGASLVEVGTASFADPRSGGRIVRELGRWGRRHAVPSWDSLVAPAPGDQKRVATPADAAAAGVP